MAVDYSRLREENELRYGTNIGEYGPTLLANRYGDRTHFFFELPQNAEDALAKRNRWHRQFAADANRRIIRTQDPAVKARTSTLDRGLLSAAQVDSERESQSN